MTRKLEWVSKLLHLYSSEPVHTPGCGPLCQGAELRVACSDISTGTHLIFIQLNLLGFLKTLTSEYKLGWGNLDDLITPDKA